MRRRARAAALALVLVLGALAGCGGGEQEPERPPPLRYVALGDSYSNGEGAGPEHAWPRLVARTATRHGLGVELLANLSVSGATSAEALAGQLPRAQAADPDVASLLIGANDHFRRVGLADYRRNVRALLRGLVAEVGEGRRVLVVSIPDYGVTEVVRRGSPGGGRPSIAAYDRVLAEEARGVGAARADITELSRELADDPSQTASDGLHPSARALRRWAAAIEPVARRAWR